MQPLCGVKDAVLHVKAETTGPATLVKYFPRDLPTHKVFETIPDLAEAGKSTTTTVVGKTVARQPDAVACHVPAAAKAAQGVQTPGASDDLKITLPVEFQDQLERHTFMLRHGWSDEQPSGPEAGPTAFMSLHGDMKRPPSLMSFPTYGTEEISVPHLDKMQLFAEKTAPSLDRLDPDGARVKNLIKTPAVPRFMRANQRFFFGSHDGASLHPGAVFKRPAHFANIKLSDFRTNEILYDANFEVAGHQIAADQIPLSGKITKFPTLAHDFADERIFKLTVEADNPQAEFDLEKFPVTKPKVELDHVKVQAPAAVGKATGGVHLSRTAQTHGPASERFTDNWRKMDFVFGLKHPIIETEIPISIRGLAEFI